MPEIRKYFDTYTKWDSGRWRWIPYTYNGSHSFEEQDAWNELYHRTRARKGENADLNPPDFYSAEHDADQFGIRECNITDIFGLKWHGHKGCEVEVGAPDYDGHLYYWYDKDDDEPEVSDYNDSDNPPDPNVFVEFKNCYPNFRREWIDIANIQDVDYRWVLENHLLKDSRIYYSYGVLVEDTAEVVYDDKITTFIKGLMKFKKYDLVKKLMLEINKHFDALKNSEREEEREYWPGKTAEEYFGVKYENNN